MSLSGKPVRGRFPNERHVLVYGRNQNTLLSQLYFHPYGDFSSSFVGEGQAVKNSPVKWVFYPTDSYLIDDKKPKIPERIDMILFCPCSGSLGGIAEISIGEVKQQYPDVPLVYVIQTKPEVLPELKNVPDSHIIRTELADVITAGEKYAAALISPNKGHFTRASMSDHNALLLEEAKHKEIARVNFEKIAEKDRENRDVFYRQLISKYSMLKRVNTALGSLPPLKGHARTATPSVSQSLTFAGTPTPSPTKPSASVPPSPTGVAGKPGFFVKLPPLHIPSPTQTASPAPSGDPSPVQTPTAITSHASGLEPAGALIPLRLGGN